MKLLLRIIHFFFGHSIALYPGEIHSRYLSEEHFEIFWVCSICGHIPRKGRTMFRYDRLP